MVEINNFTLTKVDRMRVNPQPNRAAAKPQDIPLSPVGKRSTVSYPEMSAGTMNAGNRAAAPRKKESMEYVEKPQYEPEHSARQSVQNIRTRDTEPMPLGRVPTNDIPSGAQRTAPVSLPSEEEYRLTPAPMSAQANTRSAGYWVDFLNRRVGQNMSVQFLLGENGPLVVQTGILVEMGADYMVLELNDTRDLLLCNLDSVKFVRFYE